MKKTYCQPTTEVVDLKTGELLESGMGLHASDPLAPNGSGSFGGGDNNGDDAKQGWGRAPGWERVESIWDEWDE